MHDDLPHAEIGQQCFSCAASRLLEILKNAWVDWDCTYDLMNKLTVTTLCTFRKTLACPDLYKI